MNISDKHRRRILFASIKGRLESMLPLLEESIYSAEEASQIIKKTPVGRGPEDTYADAEAVFAAVEEMIQTLAFIRQMAPKVGGPTQIQPMQTFQNAVADIGKINE